MADGSGQLQKCVKDFGAADEDSGTEGGRTEGIWDVLQGGSAGNVTVWVGEEGAEPPHWTGPGEFSSQGCAADHEETAKVTEEGGTEYPPLTVAMEEVVFEDITVYILKRQETVAQYIAM